MRRPTYEMQPEVPNFMEDDYYLPIVQQQSPQQVPVVQQQLPQQPSVVYYYPNGNIGVAQNNNFKYYPDCLYIESKGFKMSVPSNAIDDTLKVTLGVTAGVTLGAGLLFMFCKALGSSNINLNNLLR